MILKQSALAGGGWDRKHFFSPVREPAVGGPVYDHSTNGAALVYGLQCLVRINGASMQHSAAYSCWCIKPLAPDFF